MKPQIYHYPRPRPGRAYRRALLTTAIFALFAAASIAAFVAIYAILS